MPRNPKPPWTVPTAVTVTTMSTCLPVHQIEVSIKFTPGHFRHQHRFRGCQLRLTIQLRFALELHITNTFTTGMQEADLRISASAAQMKIEMEAIYG